MDRREQPLLLESHPEDFHATELRLTRFLSKAVHSSSRKQKRLVQVLHDQVLQDLVLITWHLHRLAEEHTPLRHDLRKRIESIEAQLQDQITIIRNLSHDIYPRIPREVDLQRDLKDIARVVSQATGIQAAVTINGDCNALDPGVAFCAYRVIRECLTNVVKHSGSEKCDIAITNEKSQLILTIRDYGKGFGMAMKSGVGIMNMRQRVRELGGEISITSNRKKGTYIAATIPTRSLLVGTQQRPGRAEG